MSESAVIPAENEDDLLKLAEKKAAERIQELKAQKQAQRLDKKKQLIRYGVICIAVAFIGLFSLVTAIML